MSSDAAWRAFDEARELFYAGNLVVRATGKPENAVPLLRRSILLILQALAATAGVQTADRKEIVSAVNAMEERDWVLRVPVLSELERLDELEKKFSSLGDPATEDEARALLRLLGAMPGVLSTVRSHLLRHGASEPRLRRKRRVRRLVVGVVTAAALIAGFALVRRSMRKAYEVVAFAGVEGTYFEDRAFSKVKATRRDDNVDFDWRSGPPLPAMPVDDFSVRWFGKLLVPAADEYTFYLSSDDGSRLFVGDKLVVDNWGDHDYVEGFGTVKLPAGPVAIRVEYYEAVGNAAIRLSWSTASRPKAIVGGESFVR